MRNILNVPHFLLTLVFYGLTDLFRWFIILTRERKGRQRTQFRKDAREESPGSKGKDSC